MDQPKPKQSPWISILILVFVLALTAGLLIYRDKISTLGQYGYPGLFIISALTNATVIIPMPTIILTTAMGAVFNPIWVAVAAGSGAAVGELSGYLAGFSGRAVVENRAWFDRLVEWMKKYGDVTILVLAFIPNPLFDMAGIIAGILKMPIYRFLFWCVLGKILKMFLFALGGATLFKGLFN